MRMAVEVTYGGDDFVYDADFDSSLYHAVGRPSDYSGGGVGGRDHGWVCDNDFEVERVRRALKPFGLTPVVRETTHPKIDKPMPSGKEISVNLPFGNE